MQTLVRLPMQSSGKHDLCQYGLTVFLSQFVPFGLLFKEGDDVSPTFHVYINLLHRDPSGQSQCLHLEDVATFPSPSALCWMLAGKLAGGCGC
jgi:hypothetical protein